MMKWMTSAATPSPAIRLARSRQLNPLVTSLLTPYVLATTDAVQANEASRFQKANRYGDIRAVPETIPGVKNTASPPHRAYRRSPRCNYA